LAALVQGLQLDEAVKVESRILIATLAALVILAGSGCKPTGSSVTRQSEQTGCVGESVGKPITEACAVAVAKAEILRQQGSQPYSRFSANYDQKEGSWAVMAIYEPEKPGGHVFVLVSNDGRILDYQLGR
jgi:hypothetical protein